MTLLDDFILLLIRSRNYIVQTEEQYIFIYEAMNEAIQSGQTEVAARNLLTHLQRLLQPINDSSLTEMELEFKVKEIEMYLSFFADHLLFVR